LAIALVLVRHAFDVTVAPDASPLALGLKTLTTYTYGGVELFFVLSGFLLGRILRSSLTPRFIGVFYLRRALRILPGYALLLVSFWFIPRYAPEIVSPSYFSDTVPLGAYVCLVQNHFFSTLRTLGAGWLLITWSLAIEVQFYLLIPWLARALRPRMLGGLCLVLVVSALVTRWNFWHVADNPFAAIYGTVSRIGTLFLGVLISLLWDNPECRQWLIASRSRLGAATICFVVLFFLLPFGPAGRMDFVVVWTPTFLGLGFATLLLWCLASENEQSHALRALSAAPLRHLGRVSYVIYLFHYPALFVSYAWFDPVTATGCWLTTVVALIGTWIFAELSWHAWEARIIGLGHKLSYRTS
jgi:peptidoglycan/LPS O-acetylase OafA/YrhL